MRGLTSRITRVAPIVAAALAAASCSAATVRHGAGARSGSAPPLCVTPSSDTYVVCALFRGHVPIPVGVNVRLMHGHTATPHGGHVLSVTHQGGLTDARIALLSADAPLRANIGVRLVHPVGSQPYLILRDAGPGDTVIASGGIVPNNRTSFVATAGGGTAHALPAPSASALPRCNVVSHETYTLCVLFRGHIDIPVGTEARVTKLGTTIVRGGRVVSVGYVQGLTDTRIAFVSAASPLYKNTRFRLVRPAGAPPYLTVRGGGPEAGYNPSGVFVPSFLTSL